MIPIIMPQVGQDIPSAKVVQWLKQENDPVEKGEVVVVVESEKAAFEIEAEQSGVLLKILHQEDEDVEVFQPLAYIGQPGETVDEATLAAPPAVAAEPEKTMQRPEAPTAQESPVADPPSRPKASPAARRLAKEKGVDLGRVTPTGPEGRILKQDVLAVAASGPTSPTVAAAGDRVVPFGKMRKEMARRLTRSKQTIPHFYLYTDVNMTEASQWRRALNREKGCNVTVTDLIVRATALALRAFERMNAHVEEDRVIIKGGVHIGLAVSVDDGLLVPVIPDCEAKSVEEIARLSKKNAEAARQGRLEAGAIGTFTVSSLGMYAMRMFLPVINPPECAILAVGAIEPRAVPVGGEIAVRDMMTLTLACDHRAVDGAYAAQFLNRIKANLETFSQTQEDD
jgi:pyruvate dehydrogenase E2 component (dihydrolipoamide acetyltransferase)